MRPEHIEQLYRAHQQRIFGLCYHITGSIADAEDCQQRTFERLLTHPPTDQNTPLAPWLTRVATNLAIDTLRARKSRDYKGLWLPEPIASSEFAVHGAQHSPAHHHEQKQLLSYALMIALEALSPQARVIWVLRDVYGASTNECAQWLDVSQSVVKTTLHRARKQLDGPQQASHVTTEQLEHAWMTWLMLQANPSYDTIIDVLHDTITVQGDSAGEYTTAYRPVRGPDHVARFFLGLLPKAQLTHLEILTFNHTPMLLLHNTPKSTRYAPRTLCVGLLDASTLKWRRFYLLSAPKKLNRTLFDHPL